MHISTMNILKIVTDGGTNHYCHQMASHVWAFDWHIYIWHFKGHSQGHTHFDNKSLGSGDRHGKHCICHQIESCMRFWLIYMHLTLTHSIGHGHDRAQFRHRIFWKRWRVWQLRYLDLTLDLFKGKGLGLGNSRFEWDWTLYTWSSQDCS